MNVRTPLLAAGISMVALALVIGLVPMFTDCQSQGRAIVLASGGTVPMKCHWTGVAALALAAPLLALGGLTAFARRKETRFVLASMGALLGAFVILLPTTLIGVCPGDDMLCNMVMRPTLVLAGVLAIAVSLATLLVPEGVPNEGLEAFA